MAPEDLETCYEFVKNLTKEAGKIVKEGFFGVKKVEKKGGRSHDLVTEYDKKVEEFLISSIKKNYPDHLFIGEETSAATKTKPVLTDAPTWIIDPIDGTTNFVHGLPCIGISVALSIKKEVVIGVVFNPVADEFYCAIKGGGAFLNGNQIHSSKVDDLNDALVSSEISLARIPFLRDRTLMRLHKAIEVAQGIRALGSAAMTLCYIASGGIDAYFIDGLQCWDVAAGMLILEEAGGSIFHPDGRKFDMLSRVLAATGNEVLKEKLVAILTECDEKTKKK